jgi:hypothetical protein
MTQFDILEHAVGFLLFAISVHGIICIYPMYVKHLLDLKLFIEVYIWQISLRFWIGLQKQSML